MTCDCCTTWPAHMTRIPLRIGREIKLFRTVCLRCFLRYGVSPYRKRKQNDTQIFVLSQVVGKAILTAT